MRGIWVFGYLGIWGVPGGAGGRPTLEKHMRPGRLGVKSGSGSLEAARGLFAGFRLWDCTGGSGF